MSSALPLRDVHLPPGPAWWPPAPGWWLLAAVVLIVLCVPLLLRWRARRRRHRWVQQFRSELDAAGEGTPRLAAVLALLRRAARQHQPGSELLQAQAWLQFLDPDARLGPAQQALLLHGAWRREVDAQALAGLETWACRRFAELLQGRAR